MENVLKEKIRKKIGELRLGRFEYFINTVLEYKYGNLGKFRDMRTHDGKTRKPNPDAFIEIEKNNKLQYIICNHSTGGFPVLKKELENIILKKDRFPEIVKYIISTNKNVPLQNITFLKRECDKQGWEFECICLDDLTRFVIDKKQFVNTHLGIDYQEEISFKLFDCGHRIKSIRVEREISKSQFIELVDIKSEKELENIENNVLECSSELILEVSKLTDVNIDWIKHGTGKKYSKLSIYDLFNTNVYDLIKQGRSVQKVIICVEPNNMNLSFLFKFTDYKIGIVAKYSNYAFWNHDEYFRETGYVVDLLNELKKIYDKYSHNVYGRIISEEDSKLIHSYDCFPKAIVDKLQDDGNFFVESLFEDELSEKSYYRKYQWFMEFHKLYRSHILNIED